MTTHVAYTSINKTKIIRIQIIFFFTWGGYASYLHALMLCYNHILISSHTFWRALTVSVASYTSPTL